MIERQLCITERVNDLQTAWTFVMSCLDEVADPLIKITPIWMSTDDFRHCGAYDVLVSGAPR